MAKKKAAKKTTGRTKARTKAGKAKAAKVKSTRARAKVKKAAPKRAKTKKTPSKPGSKKTSVNKTARKSKSKPTSKTKKKAKPTRKAPASKKKVAKKTITKRVSAKKASTKKTSTKPVKKAVKKATAKKKAVRTRPLTIEEMATEDLWGLYRTTAGKRGPKAATKLERLRNTLIERHHPLVRYIAERLLQTLPKSIELDDLVSAGLFGLMDAIRGFDASRGIKFKTYCSTRIRGAILDQLRSQDWVPRLVRLKASRIDRALQRLTAEYGREPTHAELARSLEMDHQDLVKEIQESRARSMFSLSEKWEDDDGSVEKVEILEDKQSTDPVKELNRRDLMGFITRALTHKERFIIEQYYQYGHTMREIGEMLALTESRVCQIHSNVMSRLKGLLGQKQGSLLS